MNAEQEGFIDVSFMLYCAVYALLQNDKIVYVGQAKLPMRRVYSHVNVRGKLKSFHVNQTRPQVGFKFDGIWIMPCKLSDLDRLEMEMIKKYQPKHNVRGKKTNPPLDISALIPFVKGPPVEAPIRRRV